MEYIQFNVALVCGYLNVLVTLVGWKKLLICMKYVQVDVAVVWGYLVEYFGDFNRGGKGINVYGIFTV